MSTLLRIPPHAPAAGARVSRAVTLTDELKAAQLDTLEALMNVDPQGIIADVNKEMERLMGLGRDALIGSAFASHFTDPISADQAIQLALGVEKLIDYELTTNDQQSPRTIFGRATGFRDHDGTICGVIVAANDITEQKRIQQSLQETNLQLERANRAKDCFLAGMSHELRTPLNSIIGFTGTLLMKLPGPLNAEQEKQLTTIRASANHLLSLINDLLDLAKIESGKIDLKFETVDCQSILDEVSAALRPLAEAKGLKFSVNSCQPQCSIFTDRRALLQILINLVNNAIKFTERGEVSVDLLWEQTDGQDVTRICIRDTGVGIRPQDMTKIFAAFEQAGDARPPRRDSTGLGLHLSQKLAELLGGRIECQSEIGRGTQFTLILHGTES